jgi:TrmH family RNA methyltransferase
MANKSLIEETPFSHLAVVLVAARNPLNIGAAARVMSNFGFQHLRVVNPYEVAFREARSAVGAAALLKNATQHLNIAGAVADCSLVVGTTDARNRKLDHDLRPLSEGVEAIHRHLQSGRAALLFGSEKRGLSNHDLSYCHWLVHIPTQEEHPSMNLGQAVAICLYEFVRGFNTAPTGRKQPSATSGTLDRLSAILRDTLCAAGYLEKSHGASTDHKIRRLVRRLNLSARDADVWSGMLRQVLWRMQSKD